VDGHPSSLQMPLITLALHVTLRYRTPYTKKQKKQHASGFSVLST